MFAKSIRYKQTTMNGNHETCTLPQYMDDVDMELQYKAHMQSMKRTYENLCKQIDEYGTTAGGITDKATLKRMFNRYL